MSTIVKTPRVCGGEARFFGTRIRVAAVVECMRLGWDEARILAAYPTLNRPDLACAREYAAAHPGEVEASTRGQAGHA